MLFNPYFLGVRGRSSEASTQVYQTAIRSILVLKQAIELDVKLLDDVTVHLSQGLVLLGVLGIIPFVVIYIVSPLLLSLRIDLYLIFCGLLWPLWLRQLLRQLILSGSWVVVVLDFLFFGKHLDAIEPSDPLRWFSKFNAILGGEYRLCIYIR
jgi:hypothetical protein